MPSESHCHLDLNADTAASSIANVLRIGCRELVPIASDLDTQRGQRLPHCGFQRLIEPTEEHPLVIAAASVNRYHVVALGQEGQTTRFIKSMTGQMQRGVVAGLSDSLEQIEIEISSGNAARDVRRVLLDPSSVRRYDGDRRAHDRAYMHPVVGAFGVSIGQIGKAPIAVGKAIHSGDPVVADNFLNGIVCIRHSLDFLLRTGNRMHVDETFGLRGLDLSVDHVAQGQLFFQH